MAKLKYDTMSQFSGSVGPVVLCRYKKGSYIRRRPTYNRDNLTPAQIAQKARFGTAVRFVNSIKELVGKSFFDPQKKDNGYNTAQSYISRNAIGGEYPNFLIHYEMVYIALGNLPGPDNPQVIADNDTLRFSWTISPHTGIARPTDKSIVVAHNETTKATYFSIGPVTRGMREASLHLPGENGETLHTWLAFINATHTDASRSVYTGIITL